MKSVSFSFSLHFSFSFLFLLLFQFLFLFLFYQMKSVDTLSIRWKVLTPCLSDEKRKHPAYLFLFLCIFPFYFLFPLLFRFFFFFFFYQMKSVNTLYIRWKVKFIVTSNTRYSLLLRMIQLVVISNIIENTVNNIKNYAQGWVCQVTLYSCARIYQLPCIILEPILKNVCTGQISFRSVHND